MKYVNAICSPVFYTLIYIVYCTY